MTIKVNTPNGPEEFHGASIEVAEYGTLIIRQKGAMVDFFEKSEWSDLEYVKDSE